MCRPSPPGATPPPPPCDYVDPCKSAACANDAPGTIGNVCVLKTVFYVFCKIKDNKYYDFQVVTVLL